MRAGYSAGENAEPVEFDQDQTVLPAMPCLASLIEERNRLRRGAVELLCSWPPPPRSGSGGLEPENCFWKAGQPSSEGQQRSRSSPAAAARTAYMHDKGNSAVRSRPGVWPWLPRMPCLLRRTPKVHASP
mmetsp:Transcript_81332/g.230442  ORF Transcript_81332/g.230442 Transcript_81332/m.230442 type:complete len:130 (+) Transcript_81332:21-410(+)